MADKRKYQIGDIVKYDGDEHVVIGVKEEDYDLIIVPTYDAIGVNINELDNNEDVGPEYDSAGFTEDDRVVNGQYRVISNEDADEDYKASLMQDEQRYKDKHN
jgi:hypothetical protein